ncbi:RnfH family protein [Candidatus Erwinia haradaeae]|uniref:UPF0125 protein ERCIPICE3303_563 n=1 Tax=Candidatus Erwinia haradaeae TaxID=1922217 RepID=A0A803GCW1_9GAMM|nr:RnfH family protein [Candidatus Erwinia haradaeae]VFP88706.1 UPF0125 protein RatB [Candidatus Erwinia haradaeae]
MNPNIMVDVVYALPNKQYCYHLTLAEGSTVEQSIIESGILITRKDIILQKNKFGIFGNLVNLNQKLHDGDRVEIYRPLVPGYRNLLRQKK